MTVAAGFPWGKWPKFITGEFSTGTVKPQIHMGCAAAAKIGNVKNVKA